METTFACYISRSDRSPESVMIFLPCTLIDHFSCSSAELEGVCLSCPQSVLGFLFSPSPQTSPLSFSCLLQVPRPTFRLSPLWRQKQSIPNPVVCFRTIFSSVSPWTLGYNRMSSFIFNILFCVIASKTVDIFPELACGELEDHCKDGILQGRDIWHVWGRRDMHWGGRNGETWKKEATSRLSIRWGYVFKLRDLLFE